MPLVGEHVDPAEQAAMIGGIISVIPPAEMPRYVPWIVECQVPELAVAYVDILLKLGPSPIQASWKPTLLTSRERTLRRFREAQWNSGVSWPRELKMATWQVIDRELRADPL